MPHSHLSMLLEVYYVCKYVAKLTKRVHMVLCENNFKSTQQYI